MPESGEKRRLHQVRRGKNDLERLELDVHDVEGLGGQQGAIRR